MSVDAARIHAARFTPDVEALRLQLKEIGVDLMAQTVELRHRPTLDACETLARNLEGARRTVLLLRQALLAEGCGDGE